MTDSALNVFFSTMKAIQDINKSFIFKFYEKSYKNIAKRFFRKSAVSMIFRIRLKDEFIKSFGSHRNIIKNDLNEFLNNTKSLNIEAYEAHLKSKFTNYESLFDIDILFVKRATSGRDKYSGNIAFPGGKEEKSDKDDLETAIRETKEEIGLSLCQDDPIASRYLCPNINFDVTIDFKYYVSSHLFLVFDYYNECEKLFELSKNELSDIFFVPIQYFLNINSENVEKYILYIPFERFGSKAIGKMILNKNENYLIFGLTLRKFMGVMNLDKKYIDYKQSIIFDNKVKESIFNVVIYLLKLLITPYRSYKIVRNMILLVLTLYISRSLLNVKF
jgi:8-oxo-dGTP pyrophosphatase MutT (NUDIX family)